jgi:hypothetical protein
MQRNHAMKNYLIAAGIAIVLFLFGRWTGLLPWPITLEGEVVHVSSDWSMDGSGLVTIAAELPHVKPLVVLDVRSWTTLNLKHQYIEQLKDHRIRVTGYRFLNFVVLAREIEEL